ncbi:L-lactate dehydrogenase [Tetragenococcus osmophilus]|uniref:L-lactate dehydrogenase n=1 Tax=Tetragenococcus osmophilus TaxID=526944 RepID=A0AA37XK79_9ENTE|nr:L-lactate dehydrogenase [Tetragenococcus osmophilus]AYW47791.1 L-lactate dehydrogenase [Tetragenococcus osmophilus]GMA53472.1 L-lactate dehydrogenase 2 [Alicyclobacillus contaminans]GMA72583.1 L-lactate dehydrogenase 2 [Tetragenococcus osmophilus]
MKTQKLAIIGLGNVGSSVLATAVQTELFAEIVLIDPRNQVAFGEGLDQMHAGGLSSRKNITIYVGSYKDVADADIVIIAATHVYVNEEIPADRQALLTENLPIVHEIMGNISQHTQEAMLIFVTNPADTIIHVAASYNYPKNLLLSTGTMLDSSRLRQLLGQRYHVDPKSVSGYMMGEHGYAAFPALSHLTIGGIAYHELPTYFPELALLTAEEVKEEVVQAAYDVFDAKSGVTNVAVAQSAIDIARCVLLDEKSIYPVSTPMTDDEYGFTEKCAYSVPCILGKNGVEKKLLVTLNDWEKEKLAESVASIQKSIELTL